MGIMNTLQISGRPIRPCEEVALSLWHWLASMNHLLRRTAAASRASHSGQKTHNANHPHNRAAARIYSALQSLGGSQCTRRCSEFVADTKKFIKVSALLCRHSRLVSLSGRYWLALPEAHSAVLIIVPVAVEPSHA